MSISFWVTFHLLGSPNWTQYSKCKCQIEGKDHLPGPVDLCSTYCPLGLPDPFLQSCFLNSHQPAVLQGSVPSQMQNFTLALVNFMWFLSAHFCSLSRFLWIEALPFSMLTASPSLVSFTNLQECTLSHHPGGTKQYWSWYWFLWDLH